MLTLFALNAVRIARGIAEAPPAWTPISRGLARAFEPMTPAVLRLYEPFFLWTHLLLILGFLVYIPYSKHLHIITSSINVFFSNTKPKGYLTPLRIDVDAPDSDQIRLGAATVEDLTWKEALDLYACTECGRCQSACPAWNTGKPLSPKLLIMNLRDHLFDEGPKILEAGRTSNDIRKTSLVPEVVDEEVVCACSARASRLRMSSTGWGAPARSTTEPAEFRAPWPASCGMPDCPSPSSARRSCAPATRLAASGSTTCSRRWSSRTWPHWTARESRRSWPTAPTASIRSATSTRTTVAGMRCSITPSCSPNWSKTAASGQRGRCERCSPITIPATWGGTTASTRIRGSSSIRSPACRPLRCPATGAGACVAGRGEPGCGWRSGSASASTGSAWTRPPPPARTWSALPAPFAS